METTLVRTYRASNKAAGNRTHMRSPEAADHARFENYPPRLVVWPTALLATLQTRKLSIRMVAGHREAAERKKLLVAEPWLELTISSGAGLLLTTQEVWPQERSQNRGSFRSDTLMAEASVRSRPVPPVSQFSISPC